ncbi:MAG: cold shock domain-containing protein [Acidobacteria bacterium]|nr:cold shock domain-containing protein [Acidobacteriota bacterium]
MGARRGGTRHTGTVTRVFTGRGFGFVAIDGAPAGTPAVFIHTCALMETSALHVGQRLSFKIQDTPKGPRAAWARAVSRGAGTNTVAPSQGPVGAPVL